MKPSERAKALAEDIAKSQWMDCVGTLHANDIAPDLEEAIQAAEREAFEGAREKAAMVCARHKGDGLSLHNATVIRALTYEDWQGGRG